MTGTDIAALVERLRAYVENIRGPDEPPENYLCWQAADALEALHTEVEHQRKEQKYWYDRYAELGGRNKP